jgi:type II secretory pathway component PulJ
MSRRLSDEAGFTLIELLIGASLMMVILLATLSVTDAFQRQSAQATVRLDSRDRVRAAIDKVTKRMRTAISTSSGMVEVATPTDLVYQIIGGTAPGSSDTNRTGAQRVRYCFDATTQALYRQQISWTGSAPALPSQPQACPSAAYSASSTVQAQNVANGARALFTYDFRNASTALKDLTGVTVSLYVDANGPLPPAEAGMTTAIELRNINQPPTASFTDAEVNGHILANASPSVDPEGATLAYAWYVDGSSTPSSGDIRLDVGGLLRGSTHTVQLVVTDPGALTDQVTKSITMP